jgi:high-affinity iron transporter
MLAGFLVLFRESLEALLIIGIVLGFLVRTGQMKYSMSVLTGAASGVILSVIGGVALVKLLGELSERGEALFEGVTMILAAFLLTTVILWMRKHNIAEDLKKSVSEKTLSGRKFGLFFLALLAILREGVESVILLLAAGFSTARNTCFGAALGIAAAVLLAFLIFIGSLKVDMRKFFTVMGVILILFAAGLVGQGVHALNEAGLLPSIIEHVWNVNPEVTAVGSFPLMHEKGAVGSILHELFGYNGDPSLVEVLAYAGYLAAAFVKSYTYGGKKR